MALDKATKAIASHSRLEMASLNTTKAIIEVATISKLFSKEALAEVVFNRPNIKKIGASISKTIMPIV